MTSGLDLSTQQVQQTELFDEAQTSYRDQILGFCETHSDALHRTCLAGHLTGSAAVVDPGRNASLIMHHVKLDRWLQPGGHADGVADLAQVALTEATEETGIQGLQVVQPAIDLDVHTIPARPGEPEHLHLDVRFLVITPPNCSVQGNHESHALAWWSPDSDGPQPDESTVRLLEKALTAARELG